ncbi:MAG: GDP-mannose 4,6-dehydratase [Alphaproteobacteria bacterium]|nr:GDP-mannose 4,6-dehydratase [Alphaproteobacteria bacterium]|tara:strand:+ start:1878 stop:2921 length:1044 start_codon:yes stop_codon:yes gene_type:complete
MASKRALIIGITGQDGFFLTQLLLDKGYCVDGLIQPHAHDDTQNIKIFLKDYEKVRFQLHYGDLLDGGSLTRLINKLKPDEIYNLGAQSHVAKGFDVPEYTINANGLGALRCLEAIRALGLEGKTKFYQASTSEMFGNVPSPQSENSPFSPQSPYAASKLMAHNLVQIYRDAYGIFAVSGILFNHESCFRGDDFVTQKIVRGIASIKRGDIKHIELGNLDAIRDWGHAKDYVRGMWQMLQRDQPQDYILATGKGHTVRSFCEKSFGFAGIDIVWRGSGFDEVGENKKTGEAMVMINPDFFRPLDVNNLIGDASKAREELGWVCEFSFEDIISEMVEAALLPQKDYNK